MVDIQNALLAFQFFTFSWSFWRSGKVLDVFGWRNEDDHIKEVFYEALSPRTIRFVAWTSFVFFCGWFLVKALSLQRFQKRFEFDICTHFDVVHIFLNFWNVVHDFLMAYVCMSTLWTKQCIGSWEIVAKWTLFFVVYRGKIRISGDSVSNVWRYQVKVIFLTEGLSASLTRFIPRPHWQFGVFLVNVPKIYLLSILRPCYFFCSIATEVSFSLQIVSEMVSSVRYSLTI